MDCIMEVESYSPHMKDGIMADGKEQGGSSTSAGAGTAEISEWALFGGGEGRKGWSLQWQLAAPLAVVVATSPGLANGRERVGTRTAAGMADLSGWALIREQVLILGQV